MNELLWNRLVATGVLALILLLVTWILACGHRAWNIVGWLLGAFMAYEVGLMLIMVWGGVR